MSSVEPARADVATGFDGEYRNHYRSMVQLARATTQSTAAAEEIAQDAFMQLFQRWDKVEQPIAWVRRATMSLATSWVRSAARARTTAAAEAVFLGDRGGREPAGERDAAMDVLAALATLPARQRAAVVLRYTEDLSEADIAHALGCRAGTVKSLLSRARETLRTELTR